MLHRLSVLAFASFVLCNAVACGASAPSPLRPSPSPTAIAAAPSATPSPTAISVASGIAPSTASMGHIDFAITGSDECQRQFLQGMLALHSFLYDQAHVSFAAALGADPRCAMAAWGDAMAWDRAIWYERDLTKGRAALALVTKDKEEALTAKERAFLGVARALYEKDTLKDAHEAWHAAAAAMQRDYPDDREVILQHALSLLSLYGYDSAHVREQMEAGALALRVLAANPKHPGAAHYAIHAFDSREHAILALPAARIYAGIAPAASHALHMPSHTFTHLGMWRDVVPSNEQAYAASVAWQKSRGHTPSEYDWHAYSWLVAAHLELGQPAIARKLTEAARALLVESKDDSSELRASYVSMVSNYVTATGKWDALEAMLAPVFERAFDETGTGGAVACAMHAPGGTGASRGPTVPFARLEANMHRAEAAIRLGDQASALKRVADMKAVRAQIAPWQKTLSPDFGSRWEALEDTLIARARAGSKPTATAQKTMLDALEKYQRLQSKRGTAGPAMWRTTHEILGDALLAAGKPKEALAQFAQDLDERPNRALALLGAARSAKASGQAQKAREYYAALAELWKDADADLPELTEVKEGAK